MISIKVTDNLDELTRGLSDFSRNQVPFAAALALTRTAQGVQAELKQEIVSVFDRPTPWIQRGTFVGPAKKQSLVATVGIRDQGKRNHALYVKEHFGGGARGPKPFEKAMQSAGIMPDGMRAIPGAGMKLDRYGNPDRKILREVIAQSQRTTRAWQGRGRRLALVGYFAVKPGDTNPRTHHLEPGIYRRIQKGRDNGLIPVFIFVRSADYGKVIDLEKIANKAVRALFEREFKKAIERAMETAR